MSKRKKQIAELLLKLEEISKTNQALLLENAEHKARLKTMQEETQKAKLDAVEDKTLATEQIHDITDKPTDQAPDTEIADDIVPEAEDEKTDSQDCLSENPSEKTMSLVDEIRELKVRSDRLESEIANIKKTVLIKKEAIETLSEEPTNKKPEPDTTTITRNVGKLVIDAQLGAKKILDQATIEANDRIEKARQEADIIISQAEFKSRNAYNSFCDAQDEFEHLMGRMEELLGRIKEIKKTFRS